MDLATKLIVLIVVVVLAIVAVGYLPLGDGTLKNLILFVVIAFAAVYAAKLGGLF